MTSNPWLLSLVVVIVLAAALVGLRRMQLYREQPRRNEEAFQGRVYAVGEATVSVREASEPAAGTVICMHGFMEDHRYFTALYTDPALEVILLTSAGYHPPVAQQPEPAPGARPIDAEPGTIEYDAEVLIQVMENLASYRRIRVHGHSRGGAVTIEAAIRRPDLFRDRSPDVEVLLEAAALPQIGIHPKMAANMNPVGRFLIPLTMPLMKRLPPEYYGRGMFGELAGRKRELIATYPHNPRRYAIVLANALDIEEWITTRGYEVYENLPVGYAVVGDDEQILDRESMLASARHAERLEVMETTGTSHFVTLDDPEQVPPPFVFAERARLDQQEGC